MKKFAPTFRPPRPRLFARRDPGVVVRRQIVEIQARLETRRLDLIEEIDPELDEHEGVVGAAQVMRRWQQVFDLSGLVQRTSCDAAPAENYRLGGHEPATGLEHAAYLFKRATLARNMFQGIRDQDD